MWNLALNLITLEVDISQEKMFTHNHAFFRENHSVLIMCAFQMYQRTWEKKNYAYTIPESAKTICCKCSFTAYYCVTKYKFLLIELALPSMSDNIMFLLMSIAIDPFSVFIY